MDPSPGTRDQDLRFPWCRDYPTKSQGTLWFDFHRIDIPGTSSKRRWALRSRVAVVPFPKLRTQAEALTARIFGREVPEPQWSPTGSPCELGRWHKEDLNLRHGRQSRRRRGKHPGPRMMSPVAPVSDASDSLATDHPPCGSHFRDRYS